MRKALLALFVIPLLVMPGCSLFGGLTDEQKLELIKEIKAFEKELGFHETDNFKMYSDETEAYDYYFYTPNTTLPYSLDDPLLQSAAGKPENAPIDLNKYDVFFYSIEAIAQVKTPVTKSLLRAPLPRFIHLIFHEDWHEQIDSPLGIEEPSGEVVSYMAAMLFTEKKYGKNSSIYRTLNKEFNNKLKESKLYQKYYGELDVLYSRFHSGKISEAQTLSRKVELLKSMRNELAVLWRGIPHQPNNAFIAFQMTYFRHLPLMHQVLLATDSDLVKTITVFRSVPSQGVEFETMEEVKRIETEITDYLLDTLQK